MLFKINGERNSGTNFLDSLLRINDFPTYVHEYKNNICYYWKHGIPDETIKNKNERVIDIFIFRNLNSWLVSFWKNPYHLKSINEYANFLTEKQVSKEINIFDFRNKIFLNEDDNNKTIFDIRYYKYNNIVDYKNKNKDIVFVNLDFIQNKDNAYLFLKALNEMYIKDERINYITEVKKHTKSNEEIKNRSYSLMDDNTDIINTYKDNEIETFIDNLKFEIY
jgi:hypothetical protein